MNLSQRKTRIGIAAGALAGVAGLALVTGLGPAPSLGSIAAADDSSDDSTTSTTFDDSTTSTTVDDSPSTTMPSTSAPGAGTRVVDAAGVGTVTVNSAGGRLELESATPTAGWSVEVEESSGREIEVDFRQGDQRVQVNLELEDGAIRERVRIRDDSRGIDVLTENGVVVRAEGLDGFDDNNNGDDNSGSGDDSSGTSGRDGADDTQADDSGSGGHGSDDGPGDDHGGHGDEPGDDHGGGDEPGDDSGSGGHGSDD